MFVRNIFQLNKMGQISLKIRILKIKLKVCGFWRSSQLRQNQLISAKYNKVQTTEGTKGKIGRFSIWQLHWVILDRHPMSADPGPPTQLCTQNTKWKNVKKVRREGPPTTQLCHTNQTQNQNSFCAWGPLGGPENSRELGGPDAKPLRTWGPDISKETVALLSFKF